MAQQAQESHRRAAAEENARHDAPADARFKPIKLPAVAAAMQTVKTLPHRRKAHEPPAILRRDQD